MTADAAAIHFRLLGPFEASREGEPLALGAAKQRALLARLLLNANEVVPRDRLIDDLWGEAAAKNAAHTIQVYVSSLRKALGRDVIATRAPGYLVSVDEGGLDLLRFEALQTSGREAVARGQALAAERALTEALSLFRGPPLADFAYERWAEHEVARLETARLSCHEELIEARLSLGRHAELVGELETLVKANPLRERLRGQLMLALYRQGRQAEALECYQQTRALLDDELGIEPTSDLKDIHRRILNQDPSLVPEPQPKRVQSTLPSPATSFLGRDRELAEIEALLSHADVRLLTLTGPGGTGKTRLAVETARRLTDAYADGVYWVPLASLREPGLVVSSVAQAIDAKVELVEHIGDKRLLLLLDNFEQVVDAAPEVATLLSACPHLELLVTSRESLHLNGEQIYPVPTLATSDGVELFLARARARTPDFQGNGVISVLCSRLDNLPLAIELAAARTTALSPTQILEHMSHRLDLLTGGRDTDPRQQTLRGAIEWSYDLLSESEQRLFRRLSVFAGGCALEAAQEVAEAELDVLQSLVEKSLVRFSSGRYWMLETVREFAREQLEASTEAAEVRRRHSLWLLRLAGEAEAGLRGPDAEAWLDRLDREEENLRACLAWLEAVGPVESQLDLIRGIWPRWDLRGQYVEGLRWAEPAIARSQSLRSVSRARVLYAAAALAQPIGRDDLVQELLEELLPLAREVGDGYSVSAGLQAKCYFANVAGDFAEAERLYQEAIQAAEEISDHQLIGWAKGSLADVYLRQGEFERSISTAQESLASFRAVGLEEGIGLALHNLAWGLFLAGRDEEAFDAARESGLISRRIGDPQMMVWTTLLFAALASRRGSSIVGARLIGAVEAHRSRLGLTAHGVEGVQLQTTIRELRGALGSEYEDAFAEGAELSLDDAVGLALRSHELSPQDTRTA